ncbi:MAG: cysteine--tRNA ligase [Candidatus Woesearchaeota archaeon]
MYLYNSLTKQKEPFVVLNNTVRMYNCGPTVYSTAHIGNMRSFLCVDIVRRFLESKGITVKQVMNITDVGHLTSDGDEGEDKMAVAAKKEQVDPYVIAQKYTTLFLQDLARLRIQKAHVYPKATDHIEQMIVLIEELLRNGYAYQAGANVYFDVTKATTYGALSGNTLEKLQAQQRATDDIHKKNPQDFVLWFGSSKYENHIMQWDSPFGKGYPGWHIECSAMSLQYLSECFTQDGFDAKAFESIDIHSGGEDNIFPHHEAEIAQTQGCVHKPFVRYWFHVRHLKIEGEKMSKSKGNFFVLQDLLDQGHSPQAVRLVLATTHYRQPMNLTQQALLGAQKHIEHMEWVVFLLQQAQGSGVSIDWQTYKQQFSDALDDDVNVAVAYAVLLRFVKDVHQHIDDISVQQAKIALDVFAYMQRIFAVVDIQQHTLPQQAQQLFAQRMQAKEQKDWQTADTLRQQLQSMGIDILDTKQYSYWRHKDE